MTLTLTLTLDLVPCGHFCCLGMRLDYLMLVLWVRFCIVKMAAELTEVNFQGKNVTGHCNWTVLFYGLFWSSYPSRFVMQLNKYRVSNIDCTKS